MSERDVLERDRQLTELDRDLAAVGVPVAGSRARRFFPGTYVLTIGATSGGRRASAGPIMFSIVR